MKKTIYSSHLYNSLKKKQREFCYQTAEAANTLEVKKTEKIYGSSLSENELYVIPPVFQPDKFEGNNFLWIINETENSFSYIKTDDKYTVVKNDERRLVFFSGEFTRKDFKGFPSCDFLGNTFLFNIGGSDKLTKTLSEFYWKNLLCECAERSFMTEKKHLREGYVLSTLNTDFYGGTYPAVDHEFHIRGRLAMGNSFDADIVKRMISLQLRVMKTDWRKQYRNLLSLQPNGRREYRVRRRSKNLKKRAVMFPLTANIEIVEELYNYYCLTKDLQFVKDSLSTVEKGLAYVEKHIDKNGRLWSDVYYEDQVIKHGATAQAQAFAVNSFRLMGKLERIAGSESLAEHYESLSEKMAKNYIKDVPNGYWDSQNERYIDWIEKSGKTHDHIHLLSNALSVSLKLNPEERDRKIIAMIKENDIIFQKFPTFLAADIAAYTDSEIGTGGPYDLCAAGRYWCHDAKYRKYIGEKDLILHQLLAVSKQAEADEYKMGERYDMNYVYYNTGKDAEKNWHGAECYYEYPNVFTDVLIHDYCGISGHEKADCAVIPCLSENAHIKMESYGIEYSNENNTFSLKNLKQKPLRVFIDLSKIFKSFKCDFKKQTEDGIYEIATGETIVFNGTF